MINKDSAIGIFDSGLGGLTIVKAIKERMPNERLIYFGDTLHFPYGDKSRKTLEKYSLIIGQFLVKEGCKAIVIACNSASSNAFSLLKETFGNKIPILNVIHPLILYISKKTYKKIGLIATRSTIQSRMYEKEIKYNCPHMQLCSLATPLLAPMVEEGFVNNEISSAILKYYLNQEILFGIEVLLLCCTHYPILFKEINCFYKGTIPIVEVPKLLAEQLYLTLKNRDALAKNKITEDIFYTSAFTENFNNRAQEFFGGEISFKEIYLNF